jgi:ketopantoate reductase
MNILVFGAGVIGIIYAWQLSEAGHDVALLVKPGRKQEIERKGISISCLDKRGPRKHIETVYHPTLVEDFSPTDDYELILVCVKRNQLNDILPSLAEKAGDADILFLQNNWSGTAEIEQYLAPSRFVLGFPSVGGGREENGIQCALGSDTMLGEKDGQITPRLEKIAEVIREAGFKPKLTRQIVLGLDLEITATPGGAQMLGLGVIAIGLVIGVAGYFL